MIPPDSINDLHIETFPMNQEREGDIAEIETFGLKASAPIYRWPKNRATLNYRC
jgi:hypothetical protein